MSARNTLKSLTNRVICCDNREVFAQLPDHSIDLILTDPPYKTYQSNRPQAHAKVKVIDQALFDLEYFARESYRVLKDSCHLYCFCDHLTFSEIRAELERVGFQYKNCLVWVKNNHGSGDLRGNWAPQHEFIIFASKGRGQPLNGKRRSNVLLKRHTDGSLEFFQKVSNYRYNHGTSKPVDILRIILQVSSRPGDLVFDPYGGSGSTAEACVLEERSYLLTEIDPDHHSEAQERIDELLKIERIQYQSYQQVTP
ncbi:MAG: site-specific DNA-methyltransferase [bacterium]|nr:site-specific DNA-methyltransferase [bacterium]